MSWNAPKGYGYFASIKDIKYILLERREIKKGDNGTAPMSKEQEIEYKKLNDFIRQHTHSVNIRRNKKLIFPILKVTLAFIRAELPLYKKRICGPKEFRKNLDNTLKKFS